MFDFDELEVAEDKDAAKQQGEGAEQEVKFGVQGTPFLQLGDPVYALGLTQAPKEVVKTIPAQVETPEVVKAVLWVPVEIPLKPAAAGKVATPPFIKEEVTSIPVAQEPERIKAPVEAALRV
ncbi:hypothetical protein AK812_SmicGene5346 [Symbiodinium microadriaticum]|uniref:Uncharacterized protein n=1 Tax=Symbiodinium microadriaticum TaxID=2951 RepID=A0A1Q9ETZ9_SYMMI|nr:hypothetical protein AK812_SmicGene5346 [Symbiodinium microadriaticum]